MKLQRTISPLSLLFAAIGGIVGSGWLFGPFYTAQVAGPAAILSWIIGGVLMMIIALTFAELATTFPVAGGTVRFLQFSHGPFASFTMAWIAWLASVIVAPIETLALLQYAANYLPWLMKEAGDTHVITGAGIAVAAILMLIMCIFNAIGINNVAKTNASIAFWKFIIPLGAAVILIHQQFHLSIFYQYAGFSPYGIRGILSALPTAGVIFSFIGYSSAIQLAAEAKNPNKAIPFAIIGGITLCILLYVFIQIAFIGALSPDDLAQGWQHLSFAKDTGPIAGLMTVLGLAWFVKILYLDAIISPFGTAFIYTAATARVNYAMSQNGYMPKFMQKLNEKGVPVVAIAINFVIGMFFFLPFPGWQNMVGFLVSCFVLSYAVGPIALVALRSKQPDVERPFRLPCAYFISLVAFYICNLIVFWTGWHTVWRMFLTIGIGYVFLGIYRFFNKQNDDLRFANSYWLFPYFIGLGLISFYGSFGGGTGLLAFGWDFIAIALLTIAIFYIATCQFTIREKD